MKTLILAGLLGGLLAAASAQTPALALPAPDPFIEMAAALHAATPDNREGLADIQRRMDRMVDDQVARWKSAGYIVSLEADTKLDDATEDFAEKLRLLTLASPEVWESSKHDADLALRSVRSAYTAIQQRSSRDWPTP